MDTDNNHNNNRRKIIKNQMNLLHIVKDVGIKWSFPSIRPVVHPSIRPVMVCWLRGGGENSGEKTRRMLKPDLDSESV
jgi:hypothetical protein